ncbi:MAG: hypothetical protein HKN91_09005 [Acidimicrobiia bacterium]|nr:hypothetical protein [Acidimicrobiia bacterium]
MKNGTNAAVLVTDLLAGDGPSEQVAEDFIATRCTMCERSDLDDMRFHSAGYLCNRCSAGR